MMGLFEFFKKKKPDHSEKAAAYQSFGPEEARRFFPDGPREAEGIISSLARLYGADLEALDARDYRQLLRIYAGLVDQKIRKKQEDAPVLEGLAREYGTFVTSPRAARETLTYVMLHLRDHRFVLSGQEDLDRFRRRLADKAQTGQTRAQPELRFYFETAAEFFTYCKLFGREGIHWQQGDAYLERYRKGRQFMVEGRFRWARKVLRGSLCLNPIGIRARFAVCECHIQLKEYGAAQRALNEMSPWLTTQAEIARFYRKMGQIEQERGSDVGAIACYVYSREFEDDPAVQGALEHIRAKLGRRADQVWSDPVPVLKARNIAVLRKNNP